MADASANASLALRHTRRAVLLTLQITLIFARGGDPNPRIFGVVMLVLQSRHHHLPLTAL